MNFSEFFSAEVSPWLLDHGIKIAAIIIAILILRRILKVVVEKAIRQAVPGGAHISKEAEEKRENTLIQIINGASGIVIWVIAIIMIVSELGVEIGPLLAGAGIVGVAVGFGGQYLIRDLITGLFIIWENQYRVGDVVCFGSTCGTVENVTLRVTVLRDLDGTVHTVPNGEIKQTSNLSKEFARINLNVGVSYDTDIEHVISIVNKVGEELTSDPEWGPKIIETPAFLRVDKFADSAVEVKILGMVQPLEQWAVTGELRKRLKVAFDTAGIEIPFPQRVIHSPKEQS